MSNNQDTTLRKSIRRLDSQGRTLKDIKRFDSQGATLKEHKQVKQSRCDTNKNIKKLDNQDTKVIENIKSLIYDSKAQFR